MQVLCVHRHAADKENGTPGIVGRERHHGAEGKARELAGMRGETADTPDCGKRAGALGEGRFGYIRNCRSRPGVLTIGHASMIADYGDFTRYMPAPCGGTRHVLPSLKLPRPFFSHR